MEQAEDSQDNVKDERLAVINKTLALYDSLQHMEPRLVVTTILKVAMDYVYQCAPDYDYASGGIMEMNEHLRDYYKAGMAAKTAEAEESAENP